MITSAAFSLGLTVGFFPMWLLIAPSAPETRPKLVDRANDALDAAAADSSGQLDPISPVPASPASLLAHLNRARAGLGRPPLELSSTLSDAAQKQANDLAKAGDLDAGLPATTLSSQDLENAGYRARRWVQAVANSPENAQGIVSRWMVQQPDSWKRMLDPDLRDLGIGIGRLNRMPLYSFVAAQSYDDYLMRVFSALENLGEVRQEVIRKVNLERAIADQPPLQGHHQLHRAAQRYAEEMRDSAFYGHVAPDGSTVLDRLRSAGYRARRAGENLARGAESAGEAVAGWMASEDHRKNILSPWFTEIGIGVALGRSDNGDYTILWVQCFGRPYR